MTDATVVEYIRRQGKYGWLWLDFKVNGTPFGSFGPYFSEAKRQHSLNETLIMLRAKGAKDVTPLSTSKH